MKNCESYIFVSFSFSTFWEYTMVVCKMPRAMGRTASSGCLMFISRTHIGYTIKHIHYNNTVSVLTWPWPRTWTRLWPWPTVKNITFWCLKRVLFCSPQLCNPDLMGSRARQVQFFTPALSFFRCHKNVVCHMAKNVFGCGGTHLTFCSSSSWNFHQSRDSGGAAC